MLIFDDVMVFEHREIAKIARASGCAKRFMEHEEMDHEIYVK
jgi:hypothetical protein